MTTGTVGAATPGSLSPSPMNSATIVAPEPWMAQSLCAQTDPEIFFPERGKTTHHAAKQVCDRCDVREQCLAYALRNGETEGVWGGLSPNELRKLRKARGETSKPVQVLCFRGHDLTPDNVYELKNGRTICKECARHNETRRAA